MTWLGPHGLIAAVVVAAPLAIGGTHTVTRAALAAVVALAVLWATVLNNRRLRFDGVALGLAVALGWTLLQWLPLPGGLVAALNPSAAELATQAGTALGTDGATRALTLDRAATADMALLLLCALGTYLVALNARISRRRTLVKAVLLAGILVTLVGLGHRALHATSLFGVYEPSIALTSLGLPTTLINANHAAALLLLSVCAAYALAFSTQSKRARAGYAVALLLCAGGIVLTGSLAGMALLVGLACMALGHRALHGEELTSGRRRLIIGLLPLLLIAVGAATVAISDVPVADRWTLGWQVARDNLGAGVGAGAFPMAASQLQLNWANGQLTFAHNGVLQAVADWGLPMTLLIFGLMAASWARTLWLTRSKARFVVACLAIAAMAAANLVEFSLWMPGVALPALALLAWPAGEARRKAVAGDTTSAEKRASARLGWPLRAAVLAGLLAMIPVALGALDGNARSTHDRARQLVASGDSDAASWDALLEDHPADYYLWLLGTQAAARRKAANVPVMLSHAQALAPHHPEVLRLCGLHDAPERALSCLHKLAATGLAARYRAASIAIARGEAFSEGFGARSPHAALALADIVRRREGPEAYERALLWARDTHRDAPEVAETLTVQWLGRKDRLASLNALSLSLFARANATAGEANASATSARLRQVAYLALGGVTELQDKDPLSAAQAYEAAAREVPERSRHALERSVRAWIAAGEPERAKRALDRLSKQAKARRDPKAKAAFHELRSAVAEARGEYDVAIDELRRAMAYLRDNPRLHARLARLFSKTGAPELAQRARAKAEALGGPRSN